MTALPKTLEQLFTQIKEYRILEWWDQLTEREKEEVYILYALEQRPTEGPLVWAQHEAIWPQYWPQ
jgi:hypothetical protein